MSEKISMKDVAKKAGVSVSTVSRVLNNGEYITEKTRKKVEEAVKKLNYRPNVIARGLRTKKTNSVGLILPDITNEFFGKLAKSIENVLNKNGINLLLCNSNEDARTERKYIEALLDKSVDGLIFISSGFDENMELFPENMPIVVIDRKPKTDKKIHFISSENEEGGYIATKHLIENGCKKIIMLKDKKLVSPMNARLKGYIRALKDYNLEYDSDFVIESKVDLEEIHEKILKIHNNLDFDGIFAGADRLAIGAIKTLTKLGYKIPEQIQIVGFDNIPFSEYYNPSITTVAQQIEKIGEKSSELLIELINGEKPLDKSESLYFPVYLIKRETTRWIDKNLFNLIWILKW